MSCPACFTGFAHSGTPRGAISKLPGSAIDCYISLSSTSNAPIILFFTDVFGMTFINSQLLADSYAAAGFNVYIPDLFNGHPLPPSALAFAEAEGWTKLLTPFRLLGSLPTIVPWFRSHGREAALKPLALAAASALRGLATEQGVPLLAAGFCLGGRYAALVAGPTLGGAPLVDACMCAHPSFLTGAEAAAVDRPALYCVVESDQFTARDADKAAAAQAARSVAPAALCRSIVYPGMGHGFAVRGGPSTGEMRSVVRAAFNTSPPPASIEELTLTPMPFLSQGQVHRGHCCLFQGRDLVGA